MDKLDLDRIQQDLINNPQGDDPVYLIGSIVLLLVALIIRYWQRKKKASSTPEV